MAICTYLYDKNELNIADIYFIVWNNHQRIPKTVAEAHICDLLTIKPSVSLTSSYSVSLVEHPSSYPIPPPMLDNPDELALRELLLGITFRTAGDFESSRTFLEAANGHRDSLVTNTWINGVALFELAVLELTITSHNRDAGDNFGGTGNGDVSPAISTYSQVPAETREMWKKAISKASAHLDSAQLCLGSEIDLSSRLESRIAMLRDELALKKDMLGL
jgi:hypothetical protein